MPVILNNLRTTHVDKRTINRLWPEVANVRQEYALTCPESPRTGEKDATGVRSHESVQTHRTDNPRDSQLRLEMTL